VKAIIVAAGMSSRLYPLTSELPKGLLRVGGQPILERSIGLLNASGVDDIIVVVGYCQEKIHAALRGRARFVSNPLYQRTNNMASLWLAMPAAQGDEFLYLHGDVVYHEALLARLASAPAGVGISLLVDFDSVDEEAMKVRVDDGRFVESSKAIPAEHAAGEWTGLARIGPSAAEALYARITRFLQERRYQDYDTAAFNELAQDSVTFGLLPTAGLPWCEIDTHEDLERARRMFAD
jgi:choline kinase